MNYEFTKDCEIMNCVFEVGEIVSEKAVKYYPSVMTQTEKEATHTLSRSGDTLIKVEKKAKKADSKTQSSPKKTAKKTDPVEADSVEIESEE